MRDSIFLPNRRPELARPWRCIDRINRISPEHWNRLSDGHAALQHGFLSALEDSGSVGTHGGNGADNGWQPVHLVLTPPDTPDDPDAVVPLYLKTHSYGEYVFDWAWAEAYHRHGLDYYPKLVAALPFTPLPGPRLLGIDDDRRAALADALCALAEQCGVSSLHVLFCDAVTRDLLAARGLMIRENVQFHWHNRGYDSFEAFLAGFNYARRKKIRQERRQAHGYGLDYVWLDGHQACEDDWAFLHHCYTDTYHRHASTPYLTADFWPLLATRQPDGVRLLLARDGNEPVAAAFFLIDADALYGRYWGCARPLPALHFELCYYQAIEYCITHELQRFEGGAQGEHKLSRGLEPVTTWSAHWIRHEGFRDAVDRFLARERVGIAEYVNELNDRNPLSRHDHHSRATPKAS